jgi:hypothetical protein
LAPPPAPPPSRGAPARTLQIADSIVLDV